MDEENAVYSTDGLHGDRPIYSTDGLPCRLSPGQTSYHKRLPFNLDPSITGNVCTKIDVTHDETTSYESFLLDEGQKKVEIEAETRVPNAAMFTFNKEDHTLANILRAKLVKSDHVLFAGYQVPHPLFAVFKLRVQTDGEVTPKQAVVTACKDLVQELQVLDQEFLQEWELQKAKGPAMQL